MSVTPIRPSSSAAQSTRRVSFSPVVRDALDSVERRRRMGGAALLPTDVAEYSEETPTDSHMTDVPSTTSHRTRLAAATAAAAAPTKGAGTSPARHVSESSQATTAAAPLTTVEFSLKDIPLDGKMAPPVWREASPGRGYSSRRPSPARGNSPASARLTQLHVPASSSPGDGSPVSDIHRNPYTDVARDSVNLLRRQRVVRTFFDSHEDAVRLYIRLQQLLAYRDLCHHEFQQRLHFMNSDEERQRAVAARAQRMAAQEREIERIKAALAAADVASPEFASSMNSLYSTRSGTPSERSVKRAREAKTHVSSSADKNATASLLAAATKAISSPSPNTARRGRGDTKSVAAARPPPSPRHSTPKAALEAWRRRSQSQELPPSTSTSLDDKAAVAEHLPKHQHQGYTPQDSTMNSDVALQLPGHSAAPGAAIAMVLPVRQAASPLPPRQAAPFGNSTSDVPPLPPTSNSKGGRGGSTAQTSTSSLPSSTWSLRLTPQSSTGDAAKQKPRSALLLPPSARVPTNTSQAKALPSGSVAGLVTPPRSARPPQPPAALSPSHLTPDRAARQPAATAAASTDSPLARFRRQQGYEDPVQHYRTQRSNNTTPLRSQSSLGSARRSPHLVQGRVGGEAETSRPGSVEKAAAGLVDVAPRVAAAADDTKQKKKKEERPVGAETALLRAAGAPLPSGRTEARVEKPVAPPTGKTNGASASRGSSLSPERRAAILQRAALRNASPPTSRLTKDIRSWSPASPPQQAIEGSSEGVGAGLVSSAAKPPQASSPADAADKETAAAAAAVGTDSKTCTLTTSRPGGASVWDELAALERRVGGLEGRTAELERNAAKRAVLDAIRLLRERVTLLEERTLILERDGGNDEAAAGQLEWQRS